MNEILGKIKKTGTVFLKRISKLGIIVCIVIVFFSGCFHYINIEDGSYREGDKSNTPYAVEQHTSNVIIDSTGNIATTMTAQELWEQMLKDGTSVATYLDGPEELQKLMNAQMVTDYIDTRSNPDEEINWDEINNDINSSAVQGIVKLKRAKTDGTTSTLIYTDPETFQAYIDDYNESGSEEDKQKALSYFTLEKGYVSSNFGTGASITAGTTIIIPSGLGSVHTYMGWQMITNTSSMQYKLIEQAGMNFDEEGFGRINGRYVIACTTTYGNVGDYVDFYQEDGSVIQCIIGDIKNQDDAGCNEWGHLNGTCIIEFVVDKETWYNSDHPNPGQQGFHMEWNQNLTQAINGGSYFDNPDFGNENITGTGITIGGGSSSGTTIGDDLMKWPTDGTRITSYFGPRTAPIEGASTNHGAIDIGIPTGTNVYATEAGTVTMSGWSNSGGNMVVIDHGNGYISKYLHNSQLIVAAGEKVTKGQVIALSGNTGNSTGPHLHFQIEFNGVKVDPLSFKYDNGMGDGVYGIGSDSSSLSTTATFYAKVATWNEVRETIETNDPSIEEKDITRYNMHATKINYQEFISGYRMPFDYLWALLVVSQDKDMVFELADLVYDSEIEITVHDNITTNTNITTDTYTTQMKVVTDNIKVRVTYYDDVDTKINEDGTINLPEINRKNISKGPYDGEKTEEPYTTTTTITTKSNTLATSLTKANVWIVNYAQKFEQQTQPEVTNTSHRDVKDGEYPEEPNEINNIDTMGFAENCRVEIENQYLAEYDYATAIVTNLESKYYYRTINRTVDINNTSQTTKYISSPSSLDDKTDKEAEEDNFVTILVRNTKGRSNIISAINWLYEILGNSQDTVDMIDLTKYLLYKVTENDKLFDVTNFDFSIYDPKNFKSLSDQYGGVSNIEGVPGQIYDFLLAKGVPPVGAAAILGNIEAESSFDPAATNGTHNGLCQWDIDDRFKKLETYANSKKVSWTDVQTQLEFMWSELETSYTSVKNVIMDSTNESDLEYATWYWGRYFEVYFLGDDFESTKSNSETRYEYAQHWYEQWKQNHSGSFTSSSVGEPAKIKGTDARIKWLYDGNGVPATEEENNKYLETFPVEYLDADGNRKTMNVTMHKKLKTEVQAIFRDMISVGFKIVGGDISYREWGTDDGFSGRFPQSAHTYGHAFDVNPTQNYCIYADGTIVGQYYLPGSDPYSVTDTVVDIWKQHGFYWGGDWTSPEDYMHFSYFDH